MPNFFKEELFPHSAEAKMSIRDFERRVDEKDMVIPEYQRRYVWSKKEQQGYLESISSGFPLFGPVINLDMETGLQSVMDGQNRLWTIYRYLKDEMPFKNEEDELVKFSELPDNQKRRFRAITISYLETRQWTPHHCQEFFVSMNGGGSKLKGGELINADRDNICSHAITKMSQRYLQMLKSKASEGGFQLSPAYIKRYGHFEILGTMIHMVRTGTFPVRPGQTSLDELETWRGQEASEIFQATLDRTTLILDSHKLLLTNVPRLRQKVAKETHLRLMYFFLRTGLYNQVLNKSHYARIEALLNRVLNKDNQEYKDTITWGTGETSKIYDLYLEIYEASA